MDIGVVLKQGIIVLKQGIIVLKYDIDITLLLNYLYDSEAFIHLAMIPILLKRVMP